MKFLLKLTDLKSDLTLTLGYLNPVMNNRALAFCLLLEKVSLDPLSISW